MSLSLPVSLSLSLSLSFSECTNHEAQANRSNAVPPSAMVGVWWMCS